jgi:hypothetical protein
MGGWGAVILKKESVMKKFLAVVLSVMFLGVVSAPVFAQSPSATPVAKTKTAKKTHKKKMKNKAKAKASATSAAK